MKIEMLKTFKGLPGRKYEHRKWVVLIENFVQAIEPAMVIHCENKTELKTTRTGIEQEVKKRKQAIKVHQRGLDVYVIKEILEET